LQKKCKTVHKRAGESEGAFGPDLENILTRKIQI
jgi:cytochrome c2